MISTEIHTTYTYGSSLSRLHSFYEVFMNQESLRSRRGSIEALKYSIPEMRRRNRGITGNLCGLRTPTSNRAE